MSVLLNDEEIEYHWTLPEGMSSTHYGVLSAVAKAQLKAVAEWGDGKCPHMIDLGDAGTLELPKRACKKCWEALLKETGG